MSQQPTLHKLFYTPIWEFKMFDFSFYQDELSRTLLDPSIYIAERERNGLQITRANLHKNPNLSVLTRFMQTSAETVMQEMGYQPSCNITSMWATKHRHGGFHHEHIHQNCFLAGVFYFDESPFNTSGTTFVDNSKPQMIEPPVDLSREKLLKQRETFPFKPGTLLIFPSWARHVTSPNQSAQRIVVAMNTMPVGMTNVDHFDRYNYPSVEGMQLKEYVG